MCEKAQKGDTFGRGQSNAAQDHEKSSGDQDLQKFSQVGEPKSTEKGTPGGGGSAPGDFSHTRSLPKDYPEWVSGPSKEIGLSNPEEAS